MKKNSGSTMLAVLSMLVVLSACMYGAMNFTATVSFNVVGSNAYRRATEVGDGALDYLFANWREIMKENSSSTKPPSSSFASVPLPPSTMFPTISNYTASRNLNPKNKTATKFTIGNYCVQAVDPQINYLITPPTPADTTSVAQTCLTDNTAPPVGTGMSPDQSSTYYLASVDVTLPAYGKRTVTVNMRRIFERRITSPWEYALFYNDLLEVNPGAPMTIAGWVHTNDNLYTAGNGSGTQELTFQSKVDYAKDWAYNPITFAPGDADHASSTTTLPTYPSNLPPARGETQLPFGLDPTQIFTSTTSNNTGYIELIQPPNTAQPDPIASSRYYDQADVHVIVDGSGNISLTDINGAALTATFRAKTGTGAMSPAQKGIYDTFTSAISVQNSAFQDNREAATMNMVTLDVSKISSALTATTATPAGTGYLLSDPTKPLSGPGVSGTTSNPLITGVVYVYNTAGSATTKWGVRVKNGAVLKRGLTVASQNPIYIQGDFNTGQASGSTTPTNTANNSTGSNIVSGYTEQASAFLGDAINVLSNNWSDANSSYSARNATPTTINAAFVTGIVPTSSSYSGANSYSGGAENFPRFHENWSGQTFSYYGSMIELYQSKQSVGRWGNNNVYAAPNRNWHFDTLFYTQPPPGTLQIVSYVKNRWYVQ